MRKFIKIVFNFLQRKYLVIAKRRAFNSRYKKYDQNLFKRNISVDKINKYKTKWGGYGEKVEIDTFMLSYNLSGQIDYNIVPENLFAAIIEKELNPHRQLSFFGVKNIYEKWFDNKETFPFSYFHRIDGIYYDNDFEIIEDVKTFIRKTNFVFPLIFKPSKDTYGGASILKVLDRNDLQNKIDSLRNFVCQELILQNDVLSNINNSSVNSVRSCLYRDSTGKFQVVNNSMRFGINGGLDNETAGGIVCNIRDDGQLNEYAVDKYANKFFEHPNSKIQFSSINVPLYDELNAVATQIADQVPFCNLISLDLCLDSKNKWRCIELNVGGQTIRFAQYAGKGFFGEFTDEVIRRTSKVNNK